MQQIIKMVTTMMDHMCLTMRDIVIILITLLSVALLIAIVCIIRKACQSESVIIGKPIVYDITHRSVEVKWKRSNFQRDEILQYHVSCREVKKDRWEYSLSKTANEDHAKVRFLNSGTSYVFKVHAECQNVRGQDSHNNYIISDEIKTLTLVQYWQQSRSLTILERHPTFKVIGMPVREISKETEDGHEIAQKEIGQPNPLHRLKNERTVLLVGQTGAGKTTLINAFANYIFGVNWEDDYRFQVITGSDENASDSEAYSRTKWITSYTFHCTPESRIQYTLTVIDTPGFGDTHAGLEKDEDIFDQMNTFLSHIGKKVSGKIHGIGFVVNSTISDASLFPQYIPNSVLSMFPKSAQDVLMIMTTFADTPDCAENPPVLDVLTELGVSFHANQVFAFGNGALYAEKQCDMKLNWDLGVKKLEQFFDKLHKVKYKSIKKSKNIFRERQKLEAMIVEIQPLVMVGFQQLAHLQQLQEDLETDSNKNNLVQNKIIARRVRYHQQVTNCRKCKYTCHKPCLEDKINRCKVMENSGRKNAYCSVCPANCKWNEHEHKKYYYEFYSKEVVVHRESLEEQYNSTGNIPMLLEGVSEELKSTGKQLACKLKQVRKSIRKLNENSLRPPDIISLTDYVEMLISSENIEKKDGYEERIKVLKKIMNDRHILQILLQDSDRTDTEKVEFWERLQLDVQ